MTSPAHITYDELRDRLRDAEEIINSLASAKTDAVITENGVYLLRLNEIDRTLRTARSTLEQMLEERTQQLHNELARTRQMASELQESETRFRTLAEAVPSLLWAANANGDCVYVSRRYEEFTGRPARELLGRGWETTLHPDDEIRIRSAWNHAVADGKPYEAEFRLRRFDGTYEWFDARALPITNEEGRVTRWFGAINNIHRLKEVEASLLRSNADLQEFAYVASHDLQEPVRAVCTYAELLARKLGSQTDEGTRVSLQYMVSGALRISTQIQDLLAYSRAAQESVSMTEAVDLGLVCREVLLDFAPQIEAAHAEVRYHELPVVIGNTAQLRQVFLNLIGNALKYRRSEATLQVEIRGAHRPGEWLISIRDNGQGFKHEYSERIFHIFKRLHGRELQGNGIGLAICKTIVERHGGRIWATGEPGVGATFYFTLPVRSST